VLVDGGSENLNASVDELVGEGLLSRVIALKDIQFSNSLIETLWRTMKHQWLFLHSLDTPATVTRLVAFYVPAYNDEIPHAAFQGQTPDEMYYGTGANIPAKLEQGKTKSRAARLEAHRAMTCRECPAITAK
jgi:putative transposase